MILRATARGKSAHAARAHLGENAITKAAGDIGVLNRHVFADADPLLGAPTLCVSTIEGGTARNMVPERCTFHIDIRTTPGYSHDGIAREFGALLQSDIDIHSGRIIPVSTPTEARIVRSCLAALPGAEPAGSPTASDWIHLHDLPVVKIGPGRSELSHTAEEHVEVAEVERAADVYQHIIQAYFDMRP